MILDKSSNYGAKHIYNDHVQKHKLTKKENDERRLFREVRKILKDECSLCLEKFKRSTKMNGKRVKMLAKTDCNHFFHQHCYVAMNKQNRCPICRHESPQLKIIDLNTVDLYKYKNPKNLEVKQIKQSHILNVAQFLCSKISDLDLSAQNEFLEKIVMDLKIASEKSFESMTFESCLEVINEQIICPQAKYSNSLDTFIFKFFEQNPNKHAILFSNFSKIALLLIQSADYHSSMTIRCRLKLLEEHTLYDKGADWEKLDKIFNEKNNYELVRERIARKKMANEFFVPFAALLFQEISINFCEYEYNAIELNAVRNYYTDYFDKMRSNFDAYENYKPESNILQLMNAK